MRKKVRRSLALLLALTMIVTLVKREELFVSAESSISELVYSDTDEGASEEQEVTLTEEEEAGEVQEEETLNSGQILEEEAPEPGEEQTAEVPENDEIQTDGMPETGETESETPEVNENPTVETPEAGGDSAEQVPSEATDSGKTEDKEDTDSDGEALPEESSEAPAGEIGQPSEETPGNSIEKQESELKKNEAKDTMETADAAGGEEEGIMLLSLDGVRIEDDILNSGSLKAAVDGDVKEEDLEYQWEILENGAWIEIEDSSTVDSREASYYVARDGAQKTYRVKVTYGDTTVTSGSFKVNYYDALQNGSFETPVVSEQSDISKYGDAHFIQIPNGTSGLEWKTSAKGPKWGNSQAGNDYYIEIADGSSKNYGSRWNPEINDSSDIYNISGAANGDQFAELNCQVSGALYQDILTQPGSTLYWGLEHAGRQGNDTMAVIISDTKDLPEDWNPTESNYNSRPDDVKAVITDGSGTWNFHEGTYTVPEGQYVTRFYFVAVSAKGGIADGNLLDNISFGKNVPNPPASKGTVTISKSVSGVDKDLIPAGSFTFEIKNSGGTVVNTVSLPTESGDWSYVTTMEPGTYTVTETAGNVDGYDLKETTHSVNAADEQSGRELTVNVEKKTTTAIAYTNTYAPQTAKLTIEKVFKGLTKAEIEGLINGPAKDGGSLEFDVTYTRDGESGNYSFAVKDHLTDGVLEGNGTEWTYTYTIDALLNKTYTIAEKHYEAADYQCQPKVEVTGGTAIAPADKAQADDFELKGDTKVSFTNTYIPNKDLVIHKTIVGADASLLSDLTFTVSGKDGKQEAEFKLSDMTPGENSSYTYILKAVEPGTYTVTESAYDLTDYECRTEYQIDTEGKQEGASANVTVGTDSSEEVTFTNTYASLLRTVTVKKAVDGNMGDRNQSFRFTVTPGEGVNIDTSSGKIIKNEDGTYTFTLKHNETIELTGLRKGDGFQIEEADYSSQSYITTIQKNNEAEKSGRVWETDDGTGLQENVVLTFTNRKEIDPPTGIFSETAPYALMFAVSALGILMFFVSRRRKI